MTGVQTCALPILNHALNEAESSVRVTIPSRSARFALVRSADALASVTEDSVPHFARGAEAGSTADKYIRDTVFLATVLFLVGISGHFPVRQARLGLITVGGCLLVFAVIQLLGLPGPPA